METRFIEIAYLVSAICFIFSLKGLSSPKSARTGNVIGILGMGIAITATFYLPFMHGKIPLLITIFSGGAIGIIIAQRIQMTAMPQLVAGFHSFVGLAATLIGYSALISPGSFGIGIPGAIPRLALLEMSIGAAIGAITFSGSLVAFAKLQGLLASKPLKFRGMQYVSVLLILSCICSIYYFILTEAHSSFNLMILLSLVIGVLLIVPIGGADMPVIVSMLNSYSGWAAAGIGFTLNNSLLIITGALVGASGAILSYVMCKAMNRSLFNVIFGVFLESATSLQNSDEDDRQPNITNPEEAAFLMKNSDSVIIVPGYGMAVAQSQHIIKEMVDLLKAENIGVRFAIHPVAGRMPGHMNVLLAEANIDYEDVLELEEINSDFGETDVTLVIGANDVTNPAAKRDKTSPIYGMPILEIENSHRVLFIKRSMSSGYAGIQNELFFANNTMMLFGDAKKVVEDIVKSLK